MNRSLCRAGPAILAAGLLVGCQDELPTSVAEERFPQSPETVEVLIPFEEFGRDLQVFGGFGSPSDLPSGVVANEFGGALNARTLVRIGVYPNQITFRDSTGTERTETDPDFVGGRVVIRFDTLASVLTGPVGIAAGAIAAPWDPPTATWTLAVDSLGVEEPWPEPGGGPVTDLGTVEWDPAIADSVLIEVDSAQVAAWDDRDDPTRGIRISTVVAGTRLKIDLVELRLDARPRARPDTLVTARARTETLTFVFTPMPGPPQGGFRFGGVPAWRSVFRIELPDSVSASAEVCARVQCPIPLNPDQISFAGVVMRTRSSPMGFEPVDTLRLQVRPVTAPELLPKAPLGPALGGLFGDPVAPELFGQNAGARVTLGLTDFVQDLLESREDPDQEVANTLALLSAPEPGTFGFGDFTGPGDPNPPVLQLIITLGTEVRLP